MDKAEELIKDRRIKNRKNELKTLKELYNGRNENF